MKPRLVLIVRLALTLAGLWLAGVVVIDGYGRVDRAQPADVIVILGSQVWSNGQPGPALTRRTHHAVALYRQGLAAHLLCSGGLGVYAPTEAEAACGLAERLGVPPAALYLETQAHSTEENALYTAAILREQDWTTAILVSDGYHLYRAELLFRRAGLVAYPSPAQATAGPMPPVERAYRESRELGALLWYWGKTALGWRVTDFP
jgi:uncharacterized SAM-binding protein YcdF (DUF218 family)